MRLRPKAPWSMYFWMGDDWFHYGAFRQVNLDYFTEQTEVRGNGHAIPREGLDDYTNFLEKGSAGDMARFGGEDQLPFWRKVDEHPAYDAFWQAQALDKISGGAAVDGANDVAAGAMGPGRYVGSDSQLYRGRAQGYGE